MLGVDDRTYCPVRDYKNWLDKQRKQSPLSELPSIGSKPRIRVKAWNEEHEVFNGRWVPCREITTVYFNRPIWR